MYAPVTNSARPVFSCLILLLMMTAAALVTTAADALCARSAHEKWIALDETSAEGAQLTSEITIKGLDGIVFEVGVPGILIQEMETPRGVFHKIRVPREGSLRSPGKPMLPEIVLMIAAPEFEDVAVEWEAKETERFDDLIAYPCPQEVVEDGPGGPYVSEVFAFDEATYSADAYYPESLVEVLHIGRIRDQKVIWLALRPTQYNGDRQHLLVHGEVEITLRYAGASPSLATRGTGPYEAMCRRRLIGYDERPQPEPFHLLGEGDGNLVWASGLEDCESNNTDYLIIAADKFWSGQDSVALHEFADYRASSSGFRVSIVNVDSITGTPGGTDVAIRDLINDLYESRTADYWWDGHLGFVVLVGDFKDANGSKLIERHLIPTPWDTSAYNIPWFYAADNWYACVTEDSLHPAVMLGRLPVDDGTELGNIYQKIRDYEPLPDAGWGRSVFLTAGRAIPDTTPPWNRYAAETTLVHNTFKSLLSVIPQPEFSVSILRGDTSNYPDLLDMNADSLAEGRYLTFYALHGDPCRMGYEVPRSFTACALEDYEGTCKPCVFMTFACQTARFDTTIVCFPCSSNANDCVGERFLTAGDTSGAVAYIGPTDMGAKGQSNNMDVSFFESVFDGKVPLLGMAFAEMLCEETQHEHYVNRMVILGDPALHIRYRGSSQDSCDLWVRSDPSLIWFDPPMDTVPVPLYTKLKATIRNASDVGMNIHQDSVGVAVKFSILTLEGVWNHFGTDIIRVVGAWDSTVAEATFNKQLYSLAEYDFKIEIDSDGIIPEAHRDNNEAIVSKWVGVPPSVGNLPAKPSDSPTVAYFANESGHWEHYTLFPCVNSKLYVATGRGSVLGSMTFDAEDGPLYSAVVADLRDDGRPLAVVTSQHKISCFDPFDATTTVWQWDAPDSLVLLTPPCIADFDSSGDLEVAVAASDTNLTNGFLLWLDGDGTVLHDMTSFRDTLSGAIPSCPLAVADLGDDGSYDVLVGTSNGYLLAYDGSDGSVMQRKTIKEGYPVAGVVVGDFDLSGSVEIAAAADSLVRILRGDTTVKRLKFHSLGEDRKAVGLAAGDVLDIPGALSVEVLVSHVDATDTIPRADISVFRYYDPQIGDPDFRVFSLEEQFSIDGADTVSIPVIGDLHPETGQEVVFFTSDWDTAEDDWWSTMWVWNPQSDNTVEFLRNIDGYVEAAVLCDFEGDLSPEILFATSGDNSIWSATAGTGNGRAMEWPSALGDERGRNVHAVCLSDTLLSGQLTLWGRYVIHDNARIPGGHTLTIAPGTELRFVPSSTNPPSMICEGTLIAVGRKDAPIVLTSADPSPKPGDWGSFIRQICYVPFRDSLEHVVFEYATSGIEFVTPPICSGTRAWGSYKVKSCEFRNIDGWGIDFSHPLHHDSINVDNCLFKDNVVGGVRVSMANAKITNSRFLKDEPTDSGLIYGVYFNGNFDWCRIEDNYFNAGDSFEADTSYWDYGIAVRGFVLLDVEIKRNLLLSFRQCGISLVIDSLLSSAEVHIDTNCVRSDIPYHSAAGMSFSGWGAEDVFVRGNIVFQNEYGVLSDAEPPPILGDTAIFWGNNHLVDNKVYLRNDAGDTLKAEGCWWGEEPVDSLFIGLVDYSPSVEDEPTGIEDDTGLAEPVVFALLPSYPNPVRHGGVRIRYSVPKECDVKLVVYNVLGQVIRVLHNGRAEPGWHELLWDGRNETGSSASAGIYFYRLRTPGYRASRKIVILR